MGLLRAALAAGIVTVLASGGPAWAGTGWSSAGTMNGARNESAMVVLHDGRVLVSAGMGGPYLKTTNVFDPITGTWSSTGDLLVARAAPTATVLDDGEVLLAGG